MMDDLFARQQPQFTAHCELSKNRQFNSPHLGACRVENRRTANLLVMPRTIRHQTLSCYDHTESNNRSTTVDPQSGTFVLPAHLSFDGTLNNIDDIAMSDETLANCTEIIIEHHIDELFAYSDEQEYGNIYDDNDDDDDDRDSVIHVDSRDALHNRHFQVSRRASHDAFSHADTLSDTKSTSARSSSALLVPFEFRAVLADSPDRGVAMISNFASMRGLYERISHEFDISPCEILYCTLNTPMPDMSRVLGGQIGLDDIIFVHRSSLQRKEVEILKTEESLGLTIADNGNGRAFIKHIRAESTAAKVPFIQHGDHIEAIQGESFVGKRHYDVAAALRAIPTDELLSLTLVEPRRPQLCVSNNYNSTTLSTLTKCADNFDEDEENKHKFKVLQGIEQQLEHFIGVNDAQLAQELFEAADGRSPKEFAATIAAGALSDFCFPAQVLANVWNSVNFPP